MIKTTRVNGVVHRHKDVDNAIKKVAAALLCQLGSLQKELKLLKEFEEPFQRKDAKPFKEVGVNGNGLVKDDTHYALHVKETLQGKLFGG